MRLVLVKLKKTRGLKKNYSIFINKFSKIADFSKIKQFLATKFFSVGICSGWGQLFESKGGGNHPLTPLCTSMASCITLSS